MDQRRDPLIPSSDQSEKDDLDGAEGEISPWLLPEPLGGGGRAIMYYDIF
jgi:hypothetical protein